MRSERYNVRESEPKWRKAWADAQVFKTSNDDPRPKYYVLEMFPYPSGRIHMGHVRNYAMGDVVARYRRARGYNVLHPMGWDAFGMPAENAAMQNNTHPAIWTYANIETMRAQLQSMGLSLDWSREIATCDPSYYKHQQKLFLDFLARRPRRAQEVEGQLGPGRPDGARQRAGDRRARLALGRGRRAARADAMVLQDHGLFGRSAGEPRPARPLAGEGAPDAAQLDRPLGRPDDPLRRRSGDARPLAGEPEANELEIYTTRPDTLFGAKFMAIAPDHPLAAAAARHDPKLAAFIEECRKIGTSVAAIETAEKKGYDTGLRVFHPFDPDWRLPVYVANFILMEYGTGRDFRLSGARSARPRFRQRLWPRRDAGRLPARRRPGDVHRRQRRLCRRWRSDQLPLPRRHDDRRGQGGGRATAGGGDDRQSSAGQAAGQLQAARLGHLPPALLGLPDPDHPLRELRRRPRPREGSAGQSCPTT